MRTSLRDRPGRAGRAAAEAGEHAALDRPERLAEPLRELALREPAVVGELERLALLGRQLRSASCTSAAAEAERGLVLGGRRGGAAPAARSSGSPRRVSSRRTRSTARRWTSVRIHVLALARSAEEAVGVPPDAEERLLDGVLGERLVAQDPQREAVGDPAEAVVELGQRVLVGAPRRARAAPRRRAARGRATGARAAAAPSAGHETAFAGRRAACSSAGRPRLRARA